MSRRRLWVLALVLLSLGLLARSSIHAQEERSPQRVVLLPGVVRTGGALMVSFWGAEPGSTVTVEVQDADSWVCGESGCHEEHLSMPTLLVQADDEGHGYFAVGVPCGYPAGVLRVDVGETEVSVPVLKGKWCQKHSDWVAGGR